MQTASGTIDSSRNRDDATTTSIIEAVKEACAWLVFQRPPIKIYDAWELRSTTRVIIHSYFSS
jgi:hypothetical protein